MIRTTHGVRGVVTGSTDLPWVPIWPVEDRWRLFAIGWIIGLAATTRRN